MKNERSEGKTKEEDKINWKEMRRKECWSRGGCVFDIGLQRLYWMAANAFALVSWVWHWQFTNWLIDVLCNRISVKFGKVTYYTYLCVCVCVWMYTCAHCPINLTEAQTIRPQHWHSHS